MRQLVTTEWLEKNINKVKILDATWCLPNSGRNASQEFQENHIKNSISVSYTHLTLPTSYPV